MIYFTADQHFGHANIIKLCSRPFSDVQEMDEALIENWNRRVTNGDTIYIIGDLLFRNSVPTEEYLQRLKGKKHLILGNHDNTWIRKVDIEDDLYSTPQTAMVVDIAALESRRSEQQQQKREATGLYDLDSLFEM